MRRAFAGTVNTTIGPNISAAGSGIYFVHQIPVGAVARYLMATGEIQIQTQLCGALCQCSGCRLPATSKLGGIGSLGFVVNRDTGIAGRRQREFAVRFTVGMTNDPAIRGIGRNEMSSRVIVIPTLNFGGVAIGAEG